MVANKLHSVKPVLGDWQFSYKQCKKDGTVLCRTHIGHTHLTHSYILKKDPPSQCEHCQYILTVRHILVECSQVAQTRTALFGRRDVVESFRFQPTPVLLSLKGCHFSNLIYITVIIYFVHLFTSYTPMLFYINTFF